MMKYHELSIGLVTSRHLVSNWRGLVCDHRLRWVRGLWLDGSWELLWIFLFKTNETGDSWLCGAQQLYVIRAANLWKALGCSRGSGSSESGHRGHRSGRHVWPKNEATQKVQDGRWLKEKSKDTYFVLCTLRRRWTLDIRWGGSYL